MFVQDNKNDDREIAKIIRNISPDQVHINTPLRPSSVKPLTRQELKEVELFFKSLNFISVYNGEHKKTKAISSEDTILHRGKPV